jgi:hypothetical protein
MKDRRSSLGSALSTDQGGKSAAQEFPGSADPVKADARLPTAQGLAVAGIFILRTKREARASCGVIELAFLSDPFIRLVGTFDPILELVALRRQQLCYLIGPLRTASTKMGYVTDRLSNFESMTPHDVLWGGDLGLCGTVVLIS